MVDLSDMSVVEGETLIIRTPNRALISDPITSKMLLDE